MKRLLLVIILGASLLSLGVAEPYREAKIKYDTWLEACIYTQYTCEGIPAPIVSYEKMKYRVLGWYGGGDIVHVNEKLDGVNKRSTLLHEMIHYLQVMDGGYNVPGWAEPICEMEAEAFAEVDEWLDSIGHPEKKRGPDWWIPYDHCWTWYAPPGYSEWQRWYYDIIGEPVTEPIIVYGTDVTAYAI